MSWPQHCRLTVLFLTVPPFLGFRQLGLVLGRHPSPTSCTWLYFTIVWIQLHNTLHPKLFLQLG